MMRVFVSVRINVGSFIKHFFLPFTLIFYFAFVAWAIPNFSAVYVHKYADPNFGF